MSRQRALWIAMTLAAVTAAGCATALGASPDVQRLQARASYERGLAHMRDGQASLALSAIQEAISIDGTASLYHNALGILLLELRRPDVAYEAFRRATELEPAFAEAQLNVGIALAEVGRWSDAAEAYRKAIGMPTMTVPHIAYQNLGLALYHMKRYREAEEALRFAIGLEPQMAAAYYNLGLVLVAGERTEDAKLAFRRARDLAPGTPFGRAATERLRALGDGG